MEVRVERVTSGLTLVEEDFSVPDKGARSSG